jgi:endonuclease YncB( thermonuclease family)
VRQRGFPADLIGQASVIDGDTLEIHGTRIRLWGIDAPESSQLCRGGDSLQYRCGQRAANELAAFIAKRPVTCAPMSLDLTDARLRRVLSAGSSLPIGLCARGWRWIGRDTAMGAMLRRRMKRGAMSGAYGQAALSSRGGFVIA